MSGYLLSKGINAETCLDGRFAVSVFTGSPLSVITTKYLSVATVNTCGSYQARLHKVISTVTRLVVAQTLCLELLSRLIKLPKLQLYWPGM